MNSNSRILTPVIAASVLLAACGGGQNTIIGDQNDDADNHNGNEIAYSTVATGIWPPQPVDISNAAPYVNDNPGTSIREIKHVDALNLAMQSEAVITALDTRHEVLSSDSTGAKSDPLKNTEIEIFNYDSNQVVTVSVDHNNTISIHSAAASEYQPSESEAESRRAISLAAKYLHALGHNTDPLQGAALLAHPTATQLAANGKQFYEHRTIYVTFGHGDGATPLLRATVDLSDEKVISGGPL